MGIQRVQLPLPNVVDIHRDIGGEGNRQTERILQVEERRILPQRRRFRADMRHHDQVGRILHQLPGVAMVRMIIPGTVRDHGVRFPGPDLPDDLMACSDGWKQLPIGIVQNLFRSNPQPPGRFLRFFFTAFHQFGAPDDR